MSQDWFWEGNIRSALARHLEREGWRVEADGPTVPEGAIDLVAKRDDRVLLLEVKGFPSNVYTQGPKAGMPKPTRSATQVRQWYADALLTILLTRDARSDAAIALAFPAHRTYRSLVAQTERSLCRLGAGVLLVGPSGDVETLLEPAPPKSSDTAAP
jgi:Holliday junction resolvase-like predicted endonuclease